MPRALSFWVLAAAFSMSACVVNIKPEASPPPRAEPPPLSLHVGIAVDDPDPRAEGTGVGGQMVAAATHADFGAAFADALRASRLFEDVRYPVRRDAQADRQTDLILNGSFTRSVKRDPAGIPKAVLCGLLIFLPTPFVYFDDAHGATGRVLVDAKRGEWVKEYSLEAGVTASYLIFGENDSYDLGARGAVRALASRFVEAMVADRPFFEKLARETKSHPAAASAAALAPPWQGQTSSVPAATGTKAAPEPDEGSAPAADEPLPAPPRKIPDDQL